MILAPASPIGQTCPIGDGLKLTSIRYSSPKQTVLEDGSPFYSSRAGGPFRLMPSGAALLDFESVGDERKSLTDRQKANLGYSIYKHNLENHLFDELSNEVLQERRLFLNWMNDHRDRVLDLDKDWVEDHLKSKTSAEDRMLMFLRELIRSDDPGVPPDEELLRGAGGCRSGTDLQEMWRYSVEQGWTGSLTDGSNRSDRQPRQLRTRSHAHGVVLGVVFDADAAQPAHLGGRQGGAGTGEGVEHDAGAQRQTRTHQQAQEGLWL